MSQLIAMIGRMDDPANPNSLTEVWRRPLPAVTLEALEPARYLDGLEGMVMEVGWEVMCTLLVEQWR